MTVLAGKVVHVTGGGGGLGRVLALSFASAGALTVVSDLDEDTAGETARRVAAAGAEAAFVRADVTSENDVRRLVEFTVEQFGGLDVLVNNAGGTTGSHFPAADPSHWRRWLDANLLGPMLCTQYAIAALRPRGGGAIVNIASRAGVEFGPYAAPEYAAAKAGLWRLTTALGSLAAEGIRVNCVCPDWVETEATRAAPDRPERLVPADDVADVVLRLAVDPALAGRVVLCPHDGPWGVIPVDGVFPLEPLPGLPRTLPG